LKQKVLSQSRRKRLTQKVDLTSFPELNPNPISEVDLKGQICYINPAALRLFPDLKTRGSDHPWLEDWKSVTSLLKKGKSKATRRTVTIDGRTYQQMMYYVAEIQRVRIYGLDITESEQSVRALHVTETRYRRLFEAARDGLLILDAETGQITDVNPFLIELLGYPRDKFQGKKLWECAPFRNAAASLKAFVELKRNAYTRYDDLPLETKDGRVIDVEFVGNVYQVDRHKVIQCNIREITQRKRAEAAILAAKDAAENEKLALQAVMEALPIGVAITDAQGGNVRSNKTFEAIWGGELPSTGSVSDYAEYRARWIESGEPVTPEEWASAQAVQNGKTVVGQLLELERFDHTRAQVINSAAPVRDAEGRIVGAAVALQDITELRATQERLRESEEKYRRLIENMNDLVCEVDGEAKYRFVSSQYEQILGYAPEELLGKPVRELIHPGDLKLSTPSFRKLVGGRTVSRNEWRFKHKNGEWRWFECSAQAYENSPGDVRVVVISRDITERKQAEESLRKNAQRLRQQSDMLEHAPVLVRNLKDEIILWNSGMEKLYGYSREQALGSVSHDLLQTVFPQSQEETQSALTSKGHWEGELRHKRRDGSEITVNSLQVLHYDDQGSPAAVIEVNNDITEVKKQEAELHRLNRTLRALSNVNQVMMQVQGETEFLQRVCQIVVHDCGHAMVWIGYAEEDEAKTVRPVANAGFEEGYLETLKITWADTERGRGPTGTAIRTGKPVACTNMLTDPNFSPWRAEALKRGYAASIVFPLMTGGKAFGAITIYAKEPDPFQEDEVKLLDELAGDLSFGINAIRLRDAHAKAEQAVQQSEERFRSLFNAMTEGFALHEIICDEEGNPCDYIFLDLNPAFERLTGLKREQVIGKTHNKVLPGDDPFWVRIYGKVALTGEPVHVENYSPALQRYYEVFSYRPAPHQFAVVFMEITERKQMEQALRASKDDLERIVAERTAELQSANVRLRALTRDIVTTQEEERRRVSRELHDEAGQALTALKLSLQTIQSEVPSGATMYGQQLGEAVTLTDKTLEQIRMLAQDLRPPALEAAGLDATLEGLCAEFARRTQIQVNYAGVQLPLLTGPAAICLYRFLQEALTNAARHGHATRIRVCLEKDAEGVRLVVEDNGQGFDPQSVLSGHDAPKSLGLIGMQERLMIVRGWLEIHSRPGQGACLIAHVRLEEA
jgi:PAS domain S-box-containing protein